MTAPTSMASTKPFMTMGCGSRPCCGYRPGRLASIALPTRDAAARTAALSRAASVNRMVGAALIEARGLTKRFDDFTAVDAIDFAVERGETFGFLGPNGAGKSSTMRMISAVSPVTSGTLRVLGLDPMVDGPTIKARMGVVPQQDTLDFELTVYENLLVYGRYFGIPKDVIK